MERNLVRSNVVSASDLTGKEGYLSKVDGSTTSATGDTFFGVISKGRPAGEAVEVVTGGECLLIAGDTTIAAGSPITGGASGKAMNATIGTHITRGFAKEACVADGATINAYLY